MSFESLGLSPALLRALADAGYTTPTPIQNEAIPLALAGHDLIAGAQTGTGKTAAFGLPLLQHLAGRTPDGKGPRRPRALVLAPTRELALQVHDSLRGYAKHLSLRMAAVYGGVGMQGQIDALRRGVDVLVATPGRLIDHLDRRGVDLSQVEVLVLDEADRMLDMGFLPAIKRILGGLPKQRQSLLFSATFETALKQLAQQFLREPREVQVTPVNTVAETISHRAHPVDAARKRDLLLDLLRQPDIGQTLVFSRTKHGADKLARLLNQAGIASDAIHGNRNQNQRLRALGGFKQGRIAVLVATDVAARGIDIDRLPTVINFDLPMVAEDYVHRIGRTGRAGAEGQAISLVTAEDAPLLRAINKVLGREVSLVDHAGFAPSTPIRIEAPSQPSRARPAGHNRRSHAGAPRRAHAGAGAARSRGGQGGHAAPRQPSRP